MDIDIGPGEEKVNQPFDVNNYLSYFDGFEVTPDQYKVQRQEAERLCKIWWAVGHEVDIHGIVEDEFHHAKGHIQRIRQSAMEVGWVTREGEKRTSWFWIWDDVIKPPYAQIEEVCINGAEVLVKYDYHEEKVKSDGSIVKVCCYRHEAFTWR